MEMIILNLYCGGIIGIFHTEKVESALQACRIHCSLSRMFMKSINLLRLEDLVLHKERDLFTRNGERLGGLDRL